MDPAPSRPDHGAGGTANPAPGTLTASTTSFSSAAGSAAQPVPGARGGGRSGKKRKQRGSRKRRTRRESFAVSHQPACEGSSDRPSEEQVHGVGDAPGVSKAEHRHAAAFYGLGKLGAMNPSATSFESEALLDHRNQPMLRTRRESRLGQSHRPESYRPEPPISSSFAPSSVRPRLNRHSRVRMSVASSEEEDDSSADEVDDRTPLIKPTSVHSSFVRYGTDAVQDPSSAFRRRASFASAASSGRSLRTGHSREPSRGFNRDYDVNNPPSVPGSPKTGPEIGYNDSILTGLEFARTRSLGESDVANQPRDMVIDVDGVSKAVTVGGSSPGSPQLAIPELQRRLSVALPVEEDVCFPVSGLSDLAEEDFGLQVRTGERRRRRRRVWPDLSVLEEWSREEKEARSGGIRAKKIHEPVFIGGRLRPRNAEWRRDEDAPYRFTYFNEEFQSTIHSQTMSELVQPGQTFRDLFMPDPPELEPESSEDENCQEACQEDPSEESLSPKKKEGDERNKLNRSPFSGDDDAHIPSGNRVFESGQHNPKEKQYGPRPTFWLDVLCPTDAEMRVISKAFGVHALTAEDIMTQEAREKVELFRNYYFINYRTFEQDSNSESFLQPVNMYLIVFREGLLSFHFSQSPHPANVRRRVRLLKDYLILSADWIGYAMIDDITDVFAPLIQSIENEVDDIDDTILRLHSDEKDVTSKQAKDSADGGDAVPDAAPSGSDMLRRVGDCRKRVMGIYRLLGNKADVIKGLAKRCNEQWEVAPKSEVGLYLGDIQDHIVTMTSALSHSEALLSRAHSNYLAQINIRMSERQEVAADVLGKLTVLGTIVLPMNIICGMWGMNVKVPGQDVDSLYWFWSITAGLVVFGVVCFYVAKRVYGIV